MDDESDYNYYPTYQFAVSLPEGMTADEFNKWWIKRDARMDRVIRHLRRTVERREQNIQTMWDRMESLDQR